MLKSLLAGILLLCSCSGTREFYVRVEVKVWTEMGGYSYKLEGCSVMFPLWDDLEVGDTVKVSYKK